MHLSASEIKKLLRKWHFYKAHTSVSGEEDALTKKIKAIEKAIAILDDVDQTIIRLKYFQGLELDLIQSQVFLARASVYKRLDKALEEMSYYISNTIIE